MSIQTLPDLIQRWDSGEGKPFKGRLIDWGAYTKDPTDTGCMCAQGQVLHLLGGWSPEDLSGADQSKADRATAELLGISVAHAILLRRVNDSVDGAPSIVLTHPEKVLGDQAHIVLAFWRHLDRMTSDQWDASGDAAWVAACGAVRDAAGGAAEVAARDAAWDASGDAAWVAARDAAGFAVRDTVGIAAGYASNEIQGARILREQGIPFFFLPLFGFADPEAVLAADKQA